MEKTSYYLGIDLDNDNAVISYFQLNMKEPETVSTVAGSEVYQIALILAKKHGIGHRHPAGDHRLPAALQVHRPRCGAGRRQGLKLRPAPKPLL